VKVRSGRGGEEEEVKSGSLSEVSRLSKMNFNQPVLVAIDAKGAINSFLNSHFTPKIVEFC